MKGELNMRKRKQPIRRHQTYTGRLLAGVFHADLVEVGECEQLTRKSITHTHTQSDCTNVIMNMILK